MDTSGPRVVDEATLAILQHDPAWAWLHDEAEDVYSEADVQPLRTTNVEPETIG